MGIADVVRNPNMPVTTRSDDNTYDPDGMYECLMNVWGQFHKPIMITEWGVEDITTRNAAGILVDELRPRHQIDTYANLIHFSRRVPGGLFGALEWTQDRNWEWVEGCTPDAGLMSSTTSPAFVNPSLASPYSGGLLKVCPRSGGLHGMSRIR